MRTTVTLDPDTEYLVRQDMERRGVSFTRALNDAIRAGATYRGAREPIRTPVIDMGRPRAPLDRALQLAGELEDRESIRTIGASR